MSRQRLPAHGSTLDQRSFKMADGLVIEPLRGTKCAMRAASAMARWLLPHGRSGTSALDNLGVGRFDQRAIVLGLFVLVFALFALTVPGFFTRANILLLAQNVSVLGILAIGMSIVVVTRGIDLSIVATMALSVGAALQMNAAGMDIAFALLFAALLAGAIGVLNGTLIAYAEIPALFATLATSACIYGFGRLFLISGDMVYVTSASGALAWLGHGELAGVPAPVLVLLLVAAAGFLFLRWTRGGLFLYAIGDNPATARITGLPVRALTVMAYVVSAGVATIAGLVQAMSVGGMNTRISDSLIVYDVILVVVLGGVSLSGARGGISNVLVGTLLIGTWLNGMTILDMPFTTQNAIKSAVLLAAIVIDAVLNPREEQIARQGDI